MNMEKDAHPHLKRELAGFEKEAGNFFIRIMGRFEAAHYLYAYFSDGRDEPLHGHSWKVEIFMARKDGGVNDEGMALDFLAVRNRLNELTDRMEHVCINELEEYKNVNPTAENIARWFYKGLKETVHSAGGAMREIRVYEGPENYAVFCPA